VALRFWTWKSKRIGRPPIKPELVELIVRMATENPRWSRRRIAMELAKLGLCVDKNTVARHMPQRSERPRRPPTQTWGTFVRNHLVGTLAVDFFTVPTVTFHILYVFVVLSLERRRILPVNVTEHPFAEWAARQVAEAVGITDTFKLLIRDRDGIYGAAFDRAVEARGTQQIRITPRSPCQNGYIERLVGTLGARLSITSSCSDGAICCDAFATTCGTTISIALTYRSAATPRPVE
jgi:transposase InsO family protein